MVSSSPHLVLRWIIVLGVAAVAGWAIVIPSETMRFREMMSEPGWTISRFLLTNWNLDSTPYVLPLLVFTILLATAAFRLRRTTTQTGAGQGGLREMESTDWLVDAIPISGREPFARRDGVAILCIAALAWFSSHWVAGLPVDSSGNSRFGDLPPAYHDEYSYLFQAKTFLAGRWSFPSHRTHPELFQQMHVLNEGRFASRYFPGTGLWLAPFAAFGMPYVGYRFATSWIAVGMMLAGREIGGFRVGFWTGLLTAVCPGLALFSNLLLAHHPTLVGLTAFLPAMLRFMRRPETLTALVAGTGLAFAMLCRPMTAAAFGLPFGVWMIVWIVRGRNGKSNLVWVWRDRLRWTVLMGLPLVLGGAVLLVQNQAITGNVWLSPYQEYTRIYTPRHVYGFNNVKRGEQQLGPKVLENYDLWAENLTASLAVRNVQNRLIAGSQWTLGLVPVAMVLVVFLGVTVWTDRRWKFVGLSVLSLHVAHVPYWFDGILHWHYVFETAPLFLLMTAGVTDSLRRTSHALRAPALTGVWCVLLWMAVATAYLSLDLFLLSVGLFVTPILVHFFYGGSLRTTLGTAGVGLLVFVLSAFWATPFWPVTRLEAAVSEIGFSRTQYQRFRQAADNQAGTDKVLVLVVADPADRHLDYVTNEPSLTARILYGRIRFESEIPAVARDFPERRILVFDARERSWRRVEMLEEIVR